MHLMGAATVKSGAVCDGELGATCSLYLGCPRVLVSECCVFLTLCFAGTWVEMDTNLVSEQRAHRHTHIHTVRCILEPEEAATASVL
jgi:hypothetical protein